MARRSSTLSSSFESTREEHVQIPATRQSLPGLTHELRPVDTGEEPSTVQPSWRSLFTFTTRKHLPGIVAALFITLVSSLIRPTSTIFFGKIFSVLTQFGAGSLSAHDTLEQISKWCTVLAGLGGLSWLIEGMFVLTWMVFGELQAKWVRGQMFSGMLDKEMEWYDMQKDGIGSLLIRIQT
jgi:ATP-binding cassette subfamily B (MDR/TAP) protein 1